MRFFCPTLAAEIDPSNPRPFDRMAANLANYRDPKLRDPRRAIDCARKAIAIERRNPQYWHALGVAQYREGQWQEAQDSFNNSMLLQNGGDGLDWYFMATVDWRLGKKDSARDYFQKAKAWKQKEREGEDDLKRLDQEVAGLLDPSGQPVRNEPKDVPRAALSQ